MLQAQGALVFVEMEKGKLPSISKELLSAGRQVADWLGEPLVAMVLSEKEEIAKECIALGADSVAVIKGTAEILNEGYLPDEYLLAVKTVCESLSPRILLLPHSSIGSDLAPRAAIMLNTHWFSGCTTIRITEDKTITVVRPILGGKIVNNESTNCQPLVITVREKCYEPLEPDWNRKGDIQPLNVQFDSSGSPIKLLETIREEAGVKEGLKNANKIVTGGRGVGSEAGFKVLKELAEIIGGKAGSSKGAVDRNWISADYQVGMTGTIVAPRLYLAIGLSGAIQHMAGCGKSKTIVAINTDPEAPIFKYAKYGIVADWEKVVPPMLECLKK